MEKTAEQKAEIMREVVQILAKHNCNILEAEDILDAAKWSIKYSANVMVVEVNQNGETETVIATLKPDGEVVLELVK